MTGTLFKSLRDVREVCPTTSRRLLGEGAVLVDLREPAEVARIGFGGCDQINIPLGQFEDRWREVPLDRDVILAGTPVEACRKAAWFLMYQGHERVHAMNPGLSRWLQRGFPVTGSAADPDIRPSGCCCSDAASAETGCCGTSSADSSCC